jgi:hypothetical protein
MHKHFTRHTANTEKEPYEIAFLLIMKTKKKNEKGAHLTHVLQ